MLYRSRRAFIGIFLVGSALFWLFWLFWPSEVAPRLPTIEVKRHPPALAHETTTLEGVFVLSNPTSESVRIERVHQTCTCSHATLGGKPVSVGTEIPAGDQLELRMALEPRGRLGPLSADCILQNSADLDWRFRVAGEIFPKVAFAEHDLNLGKLSPNASATGRIAVKTCSKSDSPPSPSVEDPTGRLTFKETASVVSQHGPIFERTTSFSLVSLERGLGGPQSTLLRASVGQKDDARSSGADLFVKWIEVGHIVCAPESVFFRNSKSGEHPTTKIILRAGDDRPFRILEAKARDLPVTADFNDTSAIVHELTLSLDPTALDKGFAAGLLKLATSNPEQPTVEVR